MLRHRQLRTTAIYAKVDRKALRTLGAAVAGSTAMSALRRALEDYLRIRRQLGFELKQDGRLLAGVRRVPRAGRGASTITTELAVAWARLPVDARPYHWRQRLGMVRGFARYLATIDPADRDPSVICCPPRQQRVAPYIYSEREIAALMAAAARADARAARARRSRRVIGLMAAPGCGSARRSRSTAATSTSTTASCTSASPSSSKQREVPLHPTTTEALRDYARLRDRLCRHRSTPAFFISTHGATA